MGKNCAWFLNRDVWLGGRKLCLYRRSCTHVIQSSDKQDKHMGNQFISNKFQVSIRPLSILAYPCSFVFGLVPNSNSQWTRGGGALDMSIMTGHRDMRDKQPCIHTLKPKFKELIFQQFKLTKSFWKCWLEGDPASRPLEMGTSTPDGPTRDKHVKYWMNGWMDERLQGGVCGWTNHHICCNMLRES